MSETLLLHFNCYKITVDFNLNKKYTCTGGCATTAGAHFH